MLKDSELWEVLPTREVRAHLKAAIEGKKITVVRDRGYWSGDLRALIVPLPKFEPGWPARWKKGSRVRIEKAVAALLVAIEKGFKN